MDANSSDEYSTVGVAVRVGEDIKATRARLARCGCLAALSACWYVPLCYPRLGVRVYVLVWYSRGLRNATH